MMPKLTTPHSIKYVSREQLCNGKWEPEHFISSMDSSEIGILVKCTGYISFFILVSKKLIKKSSSNHSKLRLHFSFES